MKSKTTKKALPADSPHDYRYLIDSLEDYGVLMMDKKGKIISWNEGAIKIFGYSAEEAIGKPVSIIFSSADRRRKMPALEMKTAKLKGRADDERQHLRKDGSLFWATGVMWAIKDDQGKYHGLSKLIKDISKQKMMEDTIRYQSLHDILTGLPNRRLFEERLTLKLNYAKKHDEMFSLLYLDLDDFKKVNDTLGHDSGDILLKEVAERLSKVLRKGDLLCRMGGDEFIILIDNIKKIKSVKVVVKKLMDILKPVFNISNAKIKVTSSMGVSIFPKDGKTSKILKKNADASMYIAKSAGKNCVRYSGEKNKVF
ncbi:MAG: domain S-box protein [Candidatus Nomurabacteria bacterium]|nr:domain S-box protein [Candidatus Nomurabacteria bacterium]